MPSGEAWWVGNLTLGGQTRIDAVARNRLFPGLAPEISGKRDRGPVNKYPRAFMPKRFANAEADAGAPTRSESDFTCELARHDDPLPISPASRCLDERPQPMCSIVPMFQQSLMSMTVGVSP